MVICLTILSGCGTTRVIPLQGTSQSKKIINSGEVASAQNEQFSIQITYGANNVLMGEAWIPVTVQVKNKGENFEGSARITVPSPVEEGGISYEKDFSIPQNGEKKLTISIPQLRNFTKFKVSIVQGDNVLISKEVRTGLEYGDNMEPLNVGILSNDAAALHYFDGEYLDNQFGIGVRTTELTQQSFPEDASALGSMAFLVINQFETEKLSKEQMDAMISWVEQGGVLILGTGTSAKQVLSGFPSEYLGGEIGNNHKKEMVYDAHNGKETVEVESVDLKVNGGTLLKDIVNGAKIWRVEKGNGSVIVTDFDLGSQSINEWSNNGEFATTLLEETMSDIVKSHFSYVYFGNNYDTSMANALNFYDGIAFPKTASYIILFTLYILIIGPIGYFILKKKDKREKIWILIPITALVFNGIIFISSSDSQVKDTVGTTITMVDSSTSNWREEVFVSMLNPNKKAYAIQVVNGYKQMMPFRNSYYYYNDNVNLDMNHYTIKEQEEGTIISFEKGKAFSNDIFKMTGTKKKEQGGFEKNLELTIDGISGTVTNRTGYDLVQAGIVYNGKYVSLGDMKAGETVTIKSNEVELLRNTDASSIAGLLVDNMPYRTQEERARKNQLNDIYIYFGGRFERMVDNEGYIVGIAEQYDKDYIVNSSIEESGRALFYDHFKEKPIDSKEYYVRNIMTVLESSKTGNIDQTSNRVYMDLEEAEYKFDSAYNIEEIYSSNLTSETGYREQNLHIYAWNYKTKKYEEIFKTEKKLTKNQINNYVNGHRMKLRFTCDGYSDLPIISVSGGGRDARN